MAGKLKAVTREIEVYERYKKAMTAHCKEWFKGQEVIVHFYPSTLGDIEVLNYVPDLKEYRDCPPITLKLRFEMEVNDQATVGGGVIKVRSKFGRDVRYTAAEANKYSSAVRDFNWDKMRETVMAQALWQYDRDYENYEEIQRRGVVKKAIADIGSKFDAKPDQYGRVHINGVSLSESNYKIRLEFDSCVRVPQAIKIIEGVNKSGFDKKDKYTDRW